MKAINVAIFLEMMKNEMIPYTFDGLSHTTFRCQFGAKGLGDSTERYGHYLVAYITENSVTEEDFLKGVERWLGDIPVHKYLSPYQDKDVPEKELMYIIEIIND